MTKFSGMIGYSTEQVETSPGVFEANIEERLHRGDMLRANLQSRPTNNANNDLVFNHRLSIIADADIEFMFPSMLYVIIKGHKWAVKSFEIQRPRVIINIGELYNA